MFCKNVAHLAVARGCHTWIRSLATGKRATFLQNILWESYSKFDFKQCSLNKILKILTFQREYMEMCFHGNQLSWGIKHLWPKYHSPAVIRFSTMFAPVISSQDEIYCIKNRHKWTRESSGRLTKRSVKLRLRLEMSSSQVGRPSMCWRFVTLSLYE